MMLRDYILMHQGDTFKIRSRPGITFSAEQLASHFWPYMETQVEPGRGPAMVQGEMVEFVTSRGLQCRFTLSTKENKDGD